MRNQNVLIQKMLTLATALIAIMVLTSACGPKKSTQVSRNSPGSPAGHNPGVPGSTPGTCPQCAGDALLLRTGSTIDTGGVTQALVMNLDLVGQSSGQYNFADPKIAIQYMGPVRGIGEVIIKSSVYRLCNATPGRYVIGSQNLEPGQWSSSMARNLRMSAESGTARLVLNVVEGIPYNPQGISKAQVNRLGGTLLIESVNGQPCGEYIQMY